MSTATGLVLVVKTARHGFVSVGSYGQALTCGGVTAGLLRRYGASLQQLAVDHPERLRPYSGKGLSLADAVALLR